jgi:hypothetical protein
MNLKTNGLTTTVISFAAIILATSSLLLFLIQPVMQPQPAYSQQQQDNATAT